MDILLERRCSRPPLLLSATTGRGLRRLLRRWDRGATTGSQLTSKLHLTNSEVLNDSIMTNISDGSELGVPKLYAKSVFGLFLSYSWSHAYLMAEGHTCTTSVRSWAWTYRNSSKIIFFDAPFNQKYDLKFNPQFWAYNWRQLICILQVSIWPRSPRDRGWIR